MSSSTMCDTLKILRLPPYLSDAKRDELFKKYGALNTKTVRKSKNYSITFVKFASKEEAMKAFLQLHQLAIKGQCLSVEFAQKSMDELNEQGLLTSEADPDEKETDSTHFQTFINKLNTWASGYDYSQPPPPNIMYKYPSPTKTTLLRIAIQLLKEPAFYTQVLHLMNKMNLPPPFEELEAEFPGLKEAYDVDKYQDIFGRIIGDTEEIIDDKLLEEEDASETESEMESDEECNIRPVEVIPVKRKLTQSSKRLKIPKFVNPTKHPTSVSSVQKVIRPEDMFESVHREEVRNMKIELKSVGKLINQENTDVSISISNEEVMESEGGFGLMFPTRKDDDGREADDKVAKKPKEFISSEELAANRITANDQRVLSVFKNYHPGKPSCRLYIKNLAKQIGINDLNYIYRRYVISSLENSESQYDIRLMQEGRMKGQAFVTFQNAGQAQLALNETNGFILKDKPMVVQFAKVARS